MSNARQPSPIRLVPMCLALSLLLLCASELTGWFALLFFLPLALCMLPLCAERLWGFLILSVLFVAAVVLLLPFPHYAWLMYVCVLAPYVPVRHALRDMKKNTAATLLSIGIVLLWTALLMFGLCLLGVNVFAILSLPLTILVGLGVLFFLFLLDILYQVSVKRYQSRIRRFLLPRA